jgi:hypothetical protein
MDIQETGWESGDWSYLSQETEQLLAPQEALNSCIETILIFSNLLGRLTDTSAASLGVYIYAFRLHVFIPLDLSNQTWNC